MRVQTVLLLSGAAAATAAATYGFAVRPWRRGIMHIHRDTRIEAPVERVYALAFDPAEWKKWDPSSSYSIGGPLDQVGTTFVEEGRMMGIKMRQEWSVAEADPPRLTRLHGVGDDSDVIYRFEPEGDATHLSVDMDIELGGRVGKLIEPVIHGVVERSVRDHVEKLKASAETREPVTA